jgi:hypothetical protein
VRSANSEGPTDGEPCFVSEPRTNFTFLNLDDKMAQIRLSLGTISVRYAASPTMKVSRLNAASAFTLLRAGEYCVEVNETGNATHRDGARRPDTTAQEM